MSSIEFELEPGVYFAGRPCLVFQPGALSLPPSLQLLFLLISFLTCHLAPRAHIKCRGCISPKGAHSIHSTQHPDILSAVPRIFPIDHVSCRVYQTAPLLGAIHDLEKSPQVNIFPTNRNHKIKTHLGKIIQAQNKNYFATLPEATKQESSEVKTSVLENVGKPSSALL